MAFAIGRGVRLEIGSTEGAPISVTEVSQANPGVATSTAHGLLAKSVGYFSSATGMPRLVGQAARLSPVTANDFTLEGLDTTDYGDFTAGSFVPVTAWATVSTATDWALSGGEAELQDVSVLLDEITQKEAGLLSAQSVAVTIRQETINDAAMAKLSEVARKAGFVVMRLTYKDGNVRVYRGQPSLPTETIGTNGVGSGTFAMSVKGFLQHGAA